MTNYKKEVYPLKNKSKDGTQHYGFIIYINRAPSIRQWHKPRVMDYVFMTEDEASQEADKMISSFVEARNIPI